MDWNRIKKIYMIGIKGVGMTMLAQYFSMQGVEVSGSDISESFMTDEVLKKNNIKINAGFLAENIPGDADLIVYSTAYNQATNQELAAAMSGKIRTIKYAEALGEVFNYKHGIAVVGSHGKTTTTAWLGYVLHESGLDPSVMVGSQVPQFDGASISGKSQYLIIEADEYQNKLQYFNPRIVLLNNIDFDHPDFFSNEDDYKMVFVDFIKKIPSKGFLVANFDDPIVRRIAYANCHGKVISYALNESADYVAYDIRQQGDKQFFKVKLGVDELDGESDILSDLGDFSIQLSGKHNVSNALAVIATCVEMGVDLFKIRQFLADFSGTARRAQILGNWHGAVIIDDYAHHPTEIKATLSGIKQKYAKENLKVVFHPHTYSRTRGLLDDFAISFDDADEVIVLDIYGSAREQQGGVHSQDLVDKILLHSPEKKVLYIANQSEVENYLRDTIGKGDVLILMGAGDVFRIGEKLLNK